MVNQTIDSQFEELFVVGIGHADQPSLFKRLSKDERPTYTVVLGKNNDNSSKIAFKIGEFDSMFISYCLEGLKSELPLTQELLFQITKSAGLEFVSSKIMESDNGTLICEITFKHTTEVFTCRARISDGISIALQNKKPVQVERNLYGKLKQK